MMRVRVVAGDHLESSAADSCARAMKSRMPDPLYLSLWFSSFEADDMLPHALAVMRQFSFSVQQPGITYLALHPVSWNEPTILERRFRPGVPPEEAVLIASDLLHEDYAYLFEAFWDLWVVAENGEWTLQPSQVKFLVHGTEFDDGVYQQEGHIQVDLGPGLAFSSGGRAPDRRSGGESARQCAETGGVYQQKWKRILEPMRGCYGRSRIRTSRRN